MRIKASPYLLLVLTTLFWSGNFVLGRAVHTSIPPIGLAFWRWAIALLVLLPFALPHVRAQWPLVRQNLKLLVSYGILGVACFNTFVYIGLHSTTATNALLVNSAIPVLIVVLSRVLESMPVTRVQAAGISLSLMGVITIITRADSHVLLSLQVNRGDLWVLLAVVSWAFYTILLRRRPAGLHPLSFLCSIMVIGVLALAPLYAWEISRGHGSEPTWRRAGASSTWHCFPPFLLLYSGIRLSPKSARTRQGSFSISCRCSARYCLSFFWVNRFISFTLPVQASFFPGSTSPLPSIHSGTSVTVKKRFIVLDSPIGTHYKSEVVQASPPLNVLLREALVQRSGTMEFSVNPHILNVHFPPIAEVKSWLAGAPPTCRWSISARRCPITPRPRS